MRPPMRRVSARSSRRRVRSRSATGLTAVADVPGMHAHPVAAPLGAGLEAARRQVGDDRARPATDQAADGVRGLEARIDTDRRPLARVGAEGLRYLPVPDAAARGRRCDPVSAVTEECAGEEDAALPGSSGAGPEFEVGGSGTEFLGNEGVQPGVEFLLAGVGFGRAVEDGQYRVDRGAGVGHARPPPTYRTYTRYSPSIDRASASNDPAGANG